MHTKTVITHYRKYTHLDHIFPCLTFWLCHLVWNHLILLIIILLCHWYHAPLSTNDVKAILWDTWDTHTLCRNAITNNAHPNPLMLYGIYLKECPYNTDISGLIINWDFAMIMLYWAVNIVLTSLKKTDCWCDARWYIEEHDRRAWYQLLPFTPFVDKGAWYQWHSNMIINKLDDFRQECVVLMLLSKL